MAEIGVCSALHAVVAVAEEHDVAVERQDLLLAEPLLELDSEKRLRDLALPVLLVGQEELAGELHGDRRGALGVTPAPQIDHHGAQDPEGVDATVAEETAVLRRQEGVAQQRRDLTLVQHQSPLPGIGSESQLGIAIEYLGYELGAEARDRIDARYTNGRREGNARGDAASDRRPGAEIASGACAASLATAQGHEPTPERASGSSGGTDEGRHGRHYSLGFNGGPRDERFPAAVALNPKRRRSRPRRRAAAGAARSHSSSAAVCSRSFWESRPSSSWSRRRTCSPTP